MYGDPTGREMSSCFEQMKDMHAAIEALKEVVSESVAAQQRTQTSLDTLVQLQQAG